MNKPFGIRGTIVPAIKDVVDEIALDDGFRVSIHDGIFEVGFNKNEDKDEATKIARNFLSAWTLRNGFNVNVDFNQTWSTSPEGNKHIGITLVENIAVTERVVTTTVISKSSAYIVKRTTDSYSFMNDTDIVKKAIRDETLSLSLNYFHDEVRAGSHQMSGVSKCIEQIIKHLDPNNETAARNKLAQMAGCNKKYIDDLMTSVQQQRHSLAWLNYKKNTQIIDEQECIARAVRLILAYADSLP